VKRRTFLQSAATLPTLVSTAAATAQSRRPAKPGSPNILLIMTDQQRYDTLGANGNPIIKTPHLDALAAESANFSHCFVQSPVCVPSRA
jgi:hypothetical protein